MYVIFIHGPAASGKYTIGSILSERLDIPLYHNHLAVDLATSLFAFGTPGFVKLRAEVWLASFAVAAEAKQPFIFTFHPEATVEPSLIDRLKNLIEDAGGVVHFVELYCSDEGVLNRLDSESRAEFGKLRDKALYQEIKNHGGFDFPALPPAIVTIDTETTSPEEAAIAIHDALSLHNAL